MSRGDILLIDDEPGTQQVLVDVLRAESFGVLEASCGASGLEMIKKHTVDVVVTDECMPDLSGMEVLLSVRKVEPALPVIFLTGYASVDLAVQAMKAGAFHFFEKPIEVHMKDFLTAIEKAVGVKRGKPQASKAPEPGIVRARFAGQDFIARDPKMIALFDLVTKVAQTDKTVLIQGESGTGKGLIARAIHELSDRMTKPLVPVSCGSLTDTLLTSELFGHVRGAFTGAVRDQKGRFEHAKDGTIFLDEIDAIPLSLQKRLLRVLQEKEFERVGDSRPIKVSARIIAASNRNLSEKVEDGSFRQDLFYRLNVIPIWVPPLRERPEDIPTLVEHFLDKYKETPMPLRVDDDVMELLKSYSWPGNVRELENLVQQLIVFNRGTSVGLPSLPRDIFYGQEVAKSTEPDPDVSLPDIVEEIEKKYILMGLKRFNWNRSLAAASLGITRKMLSDRMKKYDISHPK